MTRYASRQLFGIDVNASICVLPRPVKIGSDPRRSPARRSFVYSQRRETDVVDSDLGSVAVLFSDVLLIQITDQPSDSPIMFLLTVF